MKWNDLPHDARVRISQLKPSQMGDVAQQLGLKVSTLEVYASMFRSQQRVKAEAQSEGILFYPQSERKWDDFPVIEAEDGIFISDIHVPNGDVVWLETVLLMAIKHGIRRLFILGDSLDSNQPGISTWLATWHDTAQTPFGESVAMLKGMLRIFLTWFEEINIISGNHDQCIAKVTGGQVNLGTFLQDFDARVSFSPYRRMYVAVLRLKVEFLCANQGTFRRGNRKGTLAGALRVWVTKPFSSFPRRFDLRIGRPTKICEVSFSVTGQNRTRQAVEIDV